MKKTIFLLLGIMTLSCYNIAQSQNLLPDNSFESWKTSSTLNKWNPVKFSSLVLNAPARVTDKQDGTFAAKLKSVDITAIAKLMGLDVTSMVLPGMLFSGSVDGTKMLNLFSSINLDSINLGDISFLEQMTSILSSGVSISQKPATLSGYYKFSPIDSTEQCLISIAVFHIDTVKNKTGADSIARTLVGGAVVMDADTSTTVYKYFSAPVIYFNTELVPNEMLVIICNSLSQKVGSTLTIDNFSVIGETNLSGLAEILESEDSFKVICNRNQQTLFVNLISGKQAKVDICDMRGCLIYSNNQYINKQIINIHKSGMYILKVQVGNKTSSRKINIS